MRTKEQYIQGLRKMRRNLYVDGKLINRDDELQMDCINTLGATFDYANNPEHQELCTATSHLSGKQINRFCHVHQNKEDLHKKQDMTRLLCSAAGGVRTFGACHGGGSPVMEQIAVTTQYDIESRKQMVKRLAGIKD
jgi:aromatic ring hydroxylase